MQSRRYQKDPNINYWILFTGVDPRAFTRDFLNSNDKNMYRCWNSYDISQHLLLVRMPNSVAHEIAHGTFERKLFEALLPMSLEDRLESLRSTPFRAQSGAGKQADSSFAPDQLPQGRTDYWPTLVVETGFSESSSKLFSDVRWWLNESGGDVKMVLTIEIDRNRPQIVLEIWVLENSRMQRQQVVTVYKGNNNHVYLQGQPLVIDFEKLFLRPANTPRETDITLDDPALKKIATSVWKKQNF
ncbi:hypothetical protein NUU61_009769 [Penicillium alfredii]|uniref:Uncharacterized protein n=1 Tax=Penicillium alfredii TaxID=1506179 RepID=A0A9W9EGW8_9EURO|nr:uncharacterized protein NUU61_009769 [Penicillium alfredii]KAJ5081505.1 hypothetical protein NUU61_009769 [Penicillium alfredii]